MLQKFIKFGLQIGMGLQSPTKILIIRLQVAMGLQSLTSLDHKLPQDCKAQQITNYKVIQYTLNDLYFSKKNLLKAA